MDFSCTYISALLLIILAVLTFIAWIVLMSWTLASDPDILVSEVNFLNVFALFFNRPAFCSACVFFAGFVLLIAIGFALFGSFLILFNWFIIIIFIFYLKTVNLSKLSGLL